jgi:hypothetical protein
VELDPSDQKQILLDEALSAIEKKKKTPKQALHELAETGLFVFHGTNLTGIAELVPRQAFNKGEPDGTPAIFAATNPDIAIFQAVFNAARQQVESGDATTGWTGSHEGDVQFRTTPNVAEFLKEHPETIGEVYVLDSENFTSGDRGMVSENAVTPLTAIAVGVEDLPSNIHVYGTSDWPQSRQS